MKPTIRKRSRVMRVLAYAVVFFFATSVVAAVALRFVDPPVTMVMLLEPGSVGDIDYRWKSREHISIHAARAAIAAEDQRFLEHAGLDFKQISSAVDDWRRGDDLRGASTITQQVAKNVFLWNGRSYVRKGLDAWLAVLIDVLVPKQRILELYLNVAEFGPGVFGVEAAARRYFGVAAADLSPVQAAALIAVLPAPKRYSVEPQSEFVRSRIRQILEQTRLLEQRGHYVPLAW